MNIKKRVTSAAAVLALTAGVVAMSGGSAQAEAGVATINDGGSGFGVYCAQVAASWVEPYYSVQADGSYGPLTLKLIEQFQRDHSLQANGQIGPLTGTQLWQVINTLVIQGTSNYLTPWGVPISHCYQVLPTTS